MIKKLCLLAIFLSLTTLSLAQQSESITLTTYYPSPYGVYKNLRIYPGAQPACDAATTNDEGIIYQNQTNHIMYYCNGTSWQMMGGGGTSYTYYCYTTGTKGIFGAPACPASVTIGTQGPCASGFIVKRDLGIWGICRCVDNNDFTFPPGGSCNTPTICGSRYDVGRAYLCSQ